MDVPGQGPPEALERDAGAEGLSAGLPRGGAAADHAAHPAPLLCHTSLGSGGRHPNDPSLAGPLSDRHHVPVYARELGHLGQCGQPARPPTTAAGPNGPPLTLGQIVRQYGAGFLDAGPSALMCGRRFRTWRSAARPPWAGTSLSAITAVRSDTTIIPAATEAVLSVVAASGRPGWPNVRPTCFPCPTSTWSSPCPTNSGAGPGQPRADVSAALRQRQGDAAGGGRRSQTSGSRGSGC